MDFDSLFVYGDRCTVDWRRRDWERLFLLRWCFWNFNQIVIEVAIAVGFCSREVCTVASSAEIFRLRRSKELVRNWLKVIEFIFCLELFCKSSCPARVID